MNRSRIALFLIIPLVIFLVFQLFLKDIVNFYMSWSDPIYAYLFNGLNLATGKLEIGHTDHPGTTVQMMTAIIIRVVHLFRGSTPLAEDVLRNPEIYIKAASYFLIMLNCSVVFVVGYLVCQWTGSIALGMFFQLAPLLVKNCFYFLTNLMTEPVVVFAGLFIMLGLFYYSFYAYRDKKHQNKYILLFAILSGFTLATKVSAFPVLCLPFFLLPGIINKLKYLFVSIIFFFIFTIPIWSKFNHFYNFIYQIVVHTGQYGSGNSGIVDVKLYLAHLKLIFLEEYIFTICYLIFCLTIIFSIFKKSDIKDPKLKLLYGITTAITIQILIVAKHYSYHYLIPVDIYLVLGLYTSYLIMRPFIFSIYLRFASKKTSIILISALAIFLFVRAVAGYGLSKNIYNPILDTKKITDQKMSLPRIIASDVIAVYPESSLFFGKSYSGGVKIFYDKLLKNFYPNSYFYSSKDKIFYDWSQNYTSQEIAAMYPHFIVYINDQDSTVVSHFILLNTTKQVVRMNKIYTNQQTHEVLYEFFCDTAKASEIHQIIREIFCNADSVTSDKYFLSKDCKYKFIRGEQQSNQKSYSGKYSLKLTPNSPYGMDINLPINTNNFYELSVWRRSMDGTGVIVATSEKDPSFYKAGTAVIQSKNDGWELISLKFAIPLNLSDSVLKVYLWNNGKSDVYFDDLKIQEVKGLSKL